MKISRKKQLLEQTLLVMAVGLCTALEEGRIRIDDAEYLLFSPRTMTLIEEAGLSPELLSVIHNGTELEDVESLAPELLAGEIRKLKASAVAQLRPLPLREMGGRSWIVDCFEHERLDG